MLDEFTYRCNSRKELMCGALGAMMVGVPLALLGLWMLDGNAAYEASARAENDSLSLLHPASQYNAGSYLMHGAMLSLFLAGACVIIAIWCSWLAAFGKPKPTDAGDG